MRWVAAAALVLACGWAAAEPPERLMLIAHRGVVTDTITENSLESLEEAIRRGYTHVEVDLRVTKDGHAVCLHDSNLKRTTGIEKKIHEVTLAELQGMVSENVVPSFETYCKTAAGRIELMPDIKDYPPTQRKAFIASLDASMTKHGLVEGALFIGRNEIGMAFVRRARVATRLSAEQLARPHPNGITPANNFFVFRHAKDFNAQNVAAYRALGIPTVVSINTFHYTTGDAVQQGLDDVQKMLALKVDGLQIDAVYDGEVVGP